MNNILELLNFIFQDFTHFIGCVFLMFVAGGVLSNILSSFKLFNINIMSKQDANPNETKVNNSVLNDLISIWNKRKNNQK